MSDQRANPFRYLLSIEGFDERQDLVFILWILSRNDERIIFDKGALGRPFFEQKGDKASLIGKPVPLFIGMGFLHFLGDSFQKMIFVLDDQLFDDPGIHSVWSPNRERPIMTDSNRNSTVGSRGEQAVLDCSYFTGAFHFATVAGMRMMNLSLRQSLAYQKLSFQGSSATEAYSTLITVLDGSPISSEGVLVLSSALDVLFLGVADPLDEETLEKIANAQKLEDAVGDYILEAGRYHFAQLPLPSNLEELPYEALALTEGDVLYLRILKEGAFALVAQIWVKRRGESESGQ